MIDCVDFSTSFFILHSYQLEILHVAMERNTLVFLETGCGKTLIAVQLMNQIAHKLRVKGKKSLIVFLAPKIQLVIQVSCRIWDKCLALFELKEEM